MSKSVNLSDLDPTTQHRIIGSLHEQGLIDGSGHVKPATRRRPRSKGRRWYTWCAKTLAYVAGYLLFGLGWCLEYSGYYIKQAGEELRKVASKL